MKEKRKKDVCVRGKDEKGNQMEGPGTDETKPHLKDLGRPAWFGEYALCVHLRRISTDSPGIATVLGGCLCSGQHQPLWLPMSQAHKYTIKVSRRTLQGVQLDLENQLGYAFHGGRSGGSRAERWGINFA